MPAEVDVPSLLAYARSLLGARVAFGGVGIRLTEVEAYAGGQDPGSHAHRGRTRRTEVMFGPAGFAYVYFTYGMHHCVNLVHGPAGVAGAVLLRAGEVVDGLDLARERRPGSSERDLARGPARMAKAWGITLEHNGIAAGEPPAPMTVIGLGTVPDREVSTGPRVGVSGPGGDGEAFPWRFWITGEPTVSPYRAARPRSRG